MFRPRIIPCLLLRNGGLVKTTRFASPRYLGDPINAVRIFNEKEVDELVLLDITATAEGRGPSYQTLTDIASECFMPVAYGGGLRTLDQIERVLKLGVEKVCINSAAVENPDFVAQSAAVFGSQSIVVSIDVKRTLLGTYKAYTRSGSRCTRLDPIEAARRAYQLGAGEIFLNSIDRDGTMKGYDLKLVKDISGAVSIPVVACGGAGRIEDFQVAIDAGATAVAAGSLFVYHGKRRAVLINFPAPNELESALQQV